MIKKTTTMENMSITVCMGDERLGEIIHWQKTGVLESWHYKNTFGLSAQTIDIAMFDEQHLADAIHFAKTGERPETCLEYKTGKTTMQDAQNWIDINSDGTDFNFIIINKKD